MMWTLFRGKTQTNDWVYWNEYGELVTSSGRRKKRYAYHRTKNSISYYYYVHQLKDSNLLIKDTIGRFTDLMDVKHKKIFEDDIIRFNEELYRVRQECVTPGGYWAETGYILDHIGWADYTHFTDTIDDYYGECQVVVIGNIHDNPELLKELQNG